MRFLCVVSFASLIPLAILEPVSETAVDTVDKLNEIVKFNATCTKLNNNNNHFSSIYLFVCVFASAFLCLLLLLYSNSSYFHLVKNK